MLAVRLLAVGLAALAPAPHAERIGRSVDGRPIGVMRLGDRERPRAKVLVVGCVHGNECAGRAVVDRLERSPVPAGVELLLVRDLNPDGFAAGTRQNARGVDLNRNSPHGWRRSGTDGGPRPFSEPEARAIRALVLRERPDASFWYHQALDVVDVPFGRSHAISDRYAVRAGMRVHDLGGRPGSLTDWENGLRGVGPSIVVELPSGSLSAGSARRHAAAVLAEGRRDAARARHTRAP